MKITIEADANEMNAFFNGAKLVQPNVGIGKVDFQRIADVMRKAMQQDPLRFKNL